VFAKALLKIEKHTLPVILSERHMSGAIASGCGTFIVINRDGWILTAAHIAKQLVQHTQDRAAFEEWQRQKHEIESNPTLHPNDKHKRLRALRSKPSWVTHSAAFWGFPSAQCHQFHIDELADIAVAKLEPFDPSWVETYPVFRNPDDPMLPGTSLCRLGFPFFDINATFDEAKGGFNLAESVFPVPRFPNDGIHTRIVLQASADGTRTVQFLETSSPGLRGQSGGPIFDREGRIWAMQSRTQHLNLGFAPEVVDGNRRIVEHQFMHVGWGSHVIEIIRIFRENGISFAISDGPAPPATR
jgi:hypothetical protein